MNANQRHSCLSVAITAIFIAVLLSHHSASAQYVVPPAGGYEALNGIAPDMPQPFHSPVSPSGIAASSNLVMGSQEVRDDPGTLVAYRDSNHLGKSYLFRITGRTDGSVWGSTVYTDDSLLAVAAVHAGIVQPNQEAIVRVTILPGRPAYRGGQQHGVTSSSYGPWAGSYLVDPIEESQQSSTPPPAPENLLGAEAEIGTQFIYRATGAANGNVWGTGVYTADSSIAKAAVHAGVLAVGETGLIRVTVLPGRTMYPRSEMHGVESRAFGRYSRSYMIDPTEDSQKEREDRIRAIINYAPQPSDS